QRATGETLGDAGLAREVGAVADLRHLPQVVAADRSAAAGGRGGVDVDRVGAAGAFIPVVSEDAKHLTAEHVEAVVVAPLETVLDVRRGGAGRPHRGGPGVSAIGRFAVVDVDAGARGVLARVVEHHVDGAVAAHAEPLVEAVHRARVGRFVGGAHRPGGSAVGGEGDPDAAMVVRRGHRLGRGGVGPGDVDPVGERAAGEVGVGRDVLERAPSLHRRDIEVVAVLV